TAKHLSFVAETTNFLHYCPLEIVLALIQSIISRHADIDSPCWHRGISSPLWLEFPSTKLLKLRILPRIIPGAGSGDQSLSGSAEPNYADRRRPTFTVGPYFPNRV